MVGSYEGGQGPEGAGAPWMDGWKGGRCVRLTSPPSCAECHGKSGRQSPGTLWATPGLLRDSFQKCKHDGVICGFHAMSFRNLRISHTTVRIAADDF